jgi:hypothetical protein
MLDPIKEFEKERIIYNSPLNYTFTWHNKFKNYNNFNEEYNKYKNKLGWYIQLYDNKKKEKKIRFSSLYLPYKNLEIKELKKNIKDQIKISIKLKKNDDNFILKKNDLIYKGTKYFYTPEQEKKFYKDNLFAYYADEYWAYSYANTYFGGLNVYKLKKNIKIFNSTNDKNIKIILNLIKKKFFETGKADEIFFKNITYRKFYKSIKLKYGIGINKYYQAFLVSKISNFNDIWLYPPINDISEYTNYYDKSYTGWFFYTPSLDRICANGLRLLIKDEFGGIFCKKGFYTPFKKTTISANELIIWDQENTLIRQPEHKYDTMQFIKCLHFNPFDINFDISIYSKNTNFKMINFYIDNKIDKLEINNIKNLSVKNNQLKVMSLNVNNFKSINLNDKPFFILETLLNLIDQMKIDICFLQEYYIDLQIKSKKYNYIKNKNYIGIVVIYKNNLNIKNIKFFKLNNDSNLNQNLYYLYFNLNNKKFVTTHLEIGKSIKDNKGILHYPKKLYEVINFNYDIRINQLKQIFDQTNKPDFIIGIFNFIPLDKEYKYLTKKKNYYTGLLKKTDKQIDYIFSKKPYKFITKIKYPYSYYLPIIAIIDI